MSLKTCVVMGVFQVGDSEPGRIFEFSEYGPDCKYPSAAAFIKDVRETFRVHCKSYEITNVIIG